jgi:hypothetical protein
MYLSVGAELLVGTENDAVRRRGGKARIVNLITNEAPPGVAASDPVQQ